MKKLLFLATAAAVVLSSCSKDQTEVVPVENVKGGLCIEATMVEDGTRTYLDNGIYKWSKGDALGVFVKNNKNNAKNIAFTLDPVYDGQTSGKFVSNNTDLVDANKESFFAYYPHTPGMIAEKPLDLALQVVQQQNYQPGTFATLQAPSISDNFTLDESVSMQPVVDYLSVWAAGIKDIEYMTLAISVDGEWVKLHGTDLELASYKKGGTTRYALVPAYDDNGSYITCDEGYAIQLNCGRLEDTVVCHHSNQYVFVVPAGLLRTSGQGAVMVRIAINTNVEEVEDDTKDVDWFEFIMSAKVGMDVGNTLAIVTSNDPKSNSNLENRLHNVNSQDNPIVYNPEGDFIIRDEIDFLQYMNEYDVEGSDAYMKNAYVCGPMEDERNAATPHQLEFNFDPTHINEVATSYKGDLTNEVLNMYVSDYIANGIPCVSNYYNIFKGNGATFEAIKGLQSADGMFGWMGVERNPDYKACVENITFKNIKGADTEDWDCILARNLSDYSSFKNVVVENASNAEVLVLFADVDVIKGINLKSNNFSSEDLKAGIWYLSAFFDLEQDWTVDPEIYPVPQLFYETGSRAYDAVLRGGEQKGHNVITVTNSANAKATYAKFGDIDDDRDDDLCVSIVINGESWWTGDIINDASVIKGVYQIEYAEQLKSEYAEDAKLKLTRNMQMNGRDWETAIGGAEFDGNGKTIFDIEWDFEEETLTPVMDGGVAPFDASVVKNLTIENETFNFVTDGTYKNNSNQQYMPKAIAGLTLAATDVQDVKINNLTIFAKDANDEGESLFDNVQPFYGDGNIPAIAWAVGSSVDGLFKNIEVNVTSCNVKGQAGVISTIELKNNAESQVTNVKANVTKKEQSDLAEIAAYDVKKHNNVAGTPVFMLINNSKVARSIKFSDCGVPYLTYDKTTGNQNSKINVLNGNELVGTYNCF